MKTKELMLVYLQVSTKVDLFQKITDGNVQELYGAICTDELLNEIRNSQLSPIYICKFKEIYLKLNVG